MRRSRPAAFAALVLPLVLSACGADGVARLQTDDPNRDHPISVAQEPRELTFRTDGRGRVEVDPSLLRTVVVDHARRGHGPIALRGPAADVATLTRMLVAAGASGSSIRPEVVRGGGITLSFLAYRADPPRCGEFRSDQRAFAGNFYNTASSEFGCSMQRNLGLMLSDPRDLLQARGRDIPVDGGRPAAAVQQYGTHEKPERPSTNNLQQQN